MDSPLARQPPRTPASALRARPATTPPTRPDPGVAPGGDEGSSSGRSWDDRALEYGAPSVTPMGGRGGAWPSRVPVVAGAVAVFASELRPGHASGFMERVYVAVMRKVPVREGGDVTGQSSRECRPCRPSSVPTFSPPTSQLSPSPIPLLLPVDCLPPHFPALVAPAAPPRTPPQPGRTHSPAKTAVFSGRGPRRPSTPRPHQGLPPRTPRSAGASPTPKEDLARDLGQLAQVIEARLGESPAHGTPAPHSPVPHTLAPQTPVPEPARAGGSPLAHPSPLSPLVAGTTLSGSPGASARSAMSPEHRRALEQVRRLGDTLARVSLMAHERDVLRRCLRGWLTLSQGAPGGVRGAWAFPEEVRARLVFWVKAKASRVARRALWAWRESLGAEEGSRGEEGDGEGVEMGEGHRGEDLEVTHRAVPFLLVAWHPVLSSGDPFSDARRAEPATSWRGDLPDGWRGGPTGYPGMPCGSGGAWPWRAR